MAESKVGNKEENMEENMEGNKEGNKEEKTAHVVCNLCSCLRALL